MPCQPQHCTEAKEALGYLTHWFLQYSPVQVTASFLFRPQLRRLQRPPSGCSSCSQLGAVSVLAMSVHFKKTENAPHPLSLNESNRIFKEISREGGHIVEDEESFLGTARKA